MSQTIRYYNSLIRFYDVELLGYYFLYYSLLMTTPQVDRESFNLDIRKLHWPTYIGMLVYISIPVVSYVSAISECAGFRTTYKSIIAYLVAQNRTTKQS